MTAAALQGIKILDFSRVLAGPYSTMMLADFGAEVLKVERAGEGDDTRQWTPPVDPKTGMATYYLALNRNKKSIAVDLKNPEHLAYAKELIKDVDVVVENFRTGTMEKYGLGYEQLKDEHPHLVYCSVTGFGSGKGARLPGYDLIAQATGGLMSITGHIGEGPTKVGVAIVDAVTGLYATIGMQAALIHRMKTGEGQHVEVNLFESMLAIQTNQISGTILAGNVPGVEGNTHPSVVPYQLFDCADRQLAVAAANDHLYQLMCHALGREDLASDPRYATNPLRNKNREALIGELSALFATQGADHWFKILSDGGVPAGPINNMQQAIDLATSLGMDPVIEPSEEPPGTGVKQIRNPITLSATPATYRTSPPPMPTSLTGDE